MWMYLTKYALVRGVLEVEAEQTFPARYTTRGEANRHAEQMRVRRLLALRNQLARLQALEFK